MFFDNHKFTSYFATWRFMKSFAPVAPDPAIEKFLRGRIDNAFGIAETHLANREYIVGTQPTIADMSMCGYLYLPAGGERLRHREAVSGDRALAERLKQLPGWKPPYECCRARSRTPRW